ncbi:MAG: hypothetical protein LBS71_00550, partial [Puniceicoccales bacterium]|nr:hypothetical protein [Puniceicoccales bacterium]
IQSRAKEIVQRILYFELKNSVTGIVYALDHVQRTWSRAVSRSRKQCFLARIVRARSPYFPGGDHKGEESLLSLCFLLRKTDKINLLNKRHLIKF